MKRKSAFQYTMYIVVLVGLFAFLAGCGSDESAPSIDTSSVPQIVFYNDTGLQEVVLFEGRASDNTRVESIYLSFETPINWVAVEIDQPGSTVEWSFLAPATSFPSTINTILVRAVDSSGNETISDPVVVEVRQGFTPTSLEDAFGAALAGYVIALSSGVGDAYGDSATALTIPITVPLTVIGSGYGSTATSNGLSFSAVASTATILQSPTSAASIFSVSADLTLKNMRLLGAKKAVIISDSFNSDPKLSVEDCVFDRQGAWAVYAEDVDGGVRVEFVASVVDASYATSSSRGGLFLYNVSYQVEGSEFYYHSDPGGPEDGTDRGAAVQVVDGAGEITESIFGDNALALWASGGSPVITSCNVFATAFTTYGINLTGGSGTPVLRHNIISGNTGYGVRIGGQMVPEFRNCVISNNGRSGIFIDLDPAANAADIDLGQSNDFGFNDLFGNTYPEIPNFPDEVEVFVSSTTGFPNVSIPADGNYWGVPVNTAVRGRIYDGYQTSDSRARITYNLINVKTFPQN